MESIAASQYLADERAQFGRGDYAWDVSVEAALILELLEGSGSNIALVWVVAIGEADLVGRRDFDVGL